MKKFIQILMLAGVVGLALNGCKKDDDNPTNNPGKVTIQWEAVWGANNVPFFMDEMIFHPKTGDSLHFKNFKYYVGNIVLVKDDGTTWTDENTYHLIDLNDANSMTWDYSSVPAGTYTQIRFTMGVDSASNVNGPQTGDLDPANGMYWDATNGYISIKTNGLSPQGTNGTFTFDLGGYSSPDKAYMNREITFPTSGPLQVAESKTPIVVMWANPARLFHSYGSITNGSEILAPSSDAATMAGTFNEWATLNRIDQ